MSLIEPATGRARINHQGGEMQIVIPTKKRAFLLFFLPIWLLGWAFGVVMVTTKAFSFGDNASDGFLILWLVFWVAGGLVAIALFLWTLMGREVITANTQHLTIEKRLFSFGRKRVYRVSDSANIRVLANASTGSMLGTQGFSWGVAGGSIAFDYGMKTIKFGIFLEEAEAQYIIDELRKLVPIKD